MDLGVVLDLVTLALVARPPPLAGIRSAAEHGAKAQVDELIAELNRASALARELEKTRGTERQELRFTSYGQLWAEMRPLAIYEDSPVDQTTMGEMSKNLSGWYFSEKGGLMLTSHNRACTSRSRISSAQSPISRVGRPRGRVNPGRCSSGCWNVDDCYARTRPS